MTDLEEHSSFCRTCGAAGSGAARAPCPACGGRRITAPPGARFLTVAHIDCDAFYAAVEKRDDPALKDRPVIVGGGARGVVTTACYIARTFGVHSAMPMFQARRLCPEAVVVKPRFDAYAEAARAIRTLMEQTTPLVEPVSIDEAFLDLAGTARLHGAPAYVVLARLLARIRSEVGISASVGLSDNKFLAKIASDHEKPGGFTILPREGVATWLGRLPVRKMWGVGPAAERRLAALGVATIADLQRLDDRAMGRLFGVHGPRMRRLAHGIDSRPVTPERAAKSVSAETTFNEDVGDPAVLEQTLVRLCDRVGERMRAKGALGGAVVLKLKDTGFHTATRRRTLARPSDTAAALHSVARALLADLARPGVRYRLIGVGYCDLRDASLPRQADLFDGGDVRAGRKEAALDAIRQRFGASAIRPGADSISETGTASRAGPVRKDTRP